MWKTINDGYAFSCMNGDYNSLRKDTIRDITAELLREIDKNVKTDLKLTEMTGEKFDPKAAKAASIEDDAMLNIAASHFWSTGSKVYVDVRIY